MLNEPTCCWDEKKPERSEAVNIVFDMVRDIMRKIRDIDGIEKQQALALQLFKFLGSVTSLEDAATKLVKVAMSADSKEVEEDKKEEEGGSTGLESLYM